jgi:hypothetical protein
LDKYDADVSLNSAGIAAGVVGAAMSVAYTAMSCVTGGSMSALAALAITADAINLAFTGLQTYQLAQEVSAHDKLFNLINIYQAHKQVFDDLTTFTNDNYATSVVMYDSKATIQARINAVDTINTNKKQASIFVNHATNGYDEVVQVFGSTGGLTDKDITNYKNILNADISSAADPTTEAAMIAPLIATVASLGSLVITYIFRAITIPPIIDKIFNAK